MDVEPMPVVSITDGDGMAINSLTLAQTLVGQATSGTIRVSNTGTGATGPLAISVSGDAANDFVIDNAQTTCAGKSLEPAEGCNIVLSFRPMAVGERTATLSVASSAGTVMVGLTGFALMADLHFNPTSLAFGQLEVGKSAQTTIELRNDGSAAAPIESIAVTGAAFTKGFSTCGASLAAGSSCDITLNAAPQALGALTGNLTVTSSGTGYTAPLGVHGARKITVVTSGTGSGTISSSPAGIDCGATCTALFEGSVVLNAVPGANTQITSWSVSGCAQNPMCAVPTDITPITVTVSFALTGSASVNLVFTGTGAGEVEVRKNGVGTIATCFASCPVPAEPGDQLLIRAATFSTFGGFAGCTSVNGTLCTLTVPVGTSTVDIAFQKDVKEQWTRLIPGAVPHAAVYDGSGNLIVASTNKLTKLGPTGSTVWTLDMNVSALDTGPGDTIYIVTGTDLKKLDAAGGEIWTRIATAACTRAHGVAVASDGAVAVRSSSGNSVSRWDAAGTLAYTKAITSSAGRCSAAIDASGNVLVDIDNGNFEDTDARVFAPDGTELTRILKIVLQYFAFLSSNNAGAVAACSSGHSDAYLTAPNVSATFVIASASYAPNWCSMAGTDVGWVYWQDDTGPSQPTKWNAYRYSTGSVQAWTLARDVLQAGSDKYGTAPFAIAGSTSGRFGLVGHYAGITVDSAWVQVFDP